MKKQPPKEEQKEKRESKKERSTYRSKSSLKDETIQSIVSIVFFLLALLFILAAVGENGMAGKVGLALYSFFHYLFGLGYYLAPLLFVMLGAAFLRSLEQSFSPIKIIFGLVFFFPALGLIEIASRGAGGRVGSMMIEPLISLFDTPATVVVLVALIAISLLVIFDTHLQRDWVALLRKIGAKKENAKEDDDLAIKNSVPETDIKPLEPKITEPVEKKPEVGGIFAKKKETDPDAFDLKEMHAKHFQKEYVPPPLSLLELDRGKPGVGDVKANANIIKRTLQNFGIDVEMDEITIGPTVARYALKPAEGVRLSKISSLQDNLALALAAPTIRVEAPIPGKSLVGIEVPNSTKTTVGLGSLLSSKDYQDSAKPLLTAIGKNVSGEAVFYDLAKMPHLLIAGTTGSGKSVTVHAILNSLIFRNSPDLLKFIMVDAKRVELTLYNRIPHLLTPVITEAKKTILALKWAAKEMDRRYDVLEKNSVRDIGSYHKNILEPAFKKAKDNAKEEDAAGALPETMPYIVIVIDELADLMQAFPRELEACIVRLAQMSRAVGIHLILSTQRPSVNVITGLIKANIPTRIALKVGSQIDSRTILDKAGAEKLVGQGDMLFATQESPEPVRIQSPYISENETKKVVKYLVDNYADEIPSQVGAILDEKQEESRNPIFDPALMSDTGGGEDDDDLYEEAREIVIQAGKASTSYIQRKLRVGYARAARLMDILEERGVIGPADGAKPREVLNSGGSDEAPPSEEVF